MIEKAKKAYLIILQSILMQSLKFIEHHLLNNYGSRPNKPIFIIGPPRSGTTLLYSALITRYRFSYISNLAHRLYKTPSVATLVGKRMIRSWHGNFTNRYGQINGWASPNEGGWIWNQWFPEEYFLDEAAANRLPTQVIYKTITSIASIIDAPFLNKNVMHSVHIPLLNRLFPNCLFIITKRNILDSARSIIRIYQEKKKERGWISVKPRGWALYKEADIHSKAVAQVILTYSNIFDDIGKIGKERSLIVDYEKLCASPEIVMEEINYFLLTHGIVLKSFNCLPAFFNQSRDNYFPTEIEAKIKSIAMAINKAHNCRELNLKALEPLSQSL
jgi:hypothetical protein